MNENTSSSGSIPASPEPEKVRQPTDKLLPCPFCGGEGLPDCIFVSHEEVHYFVRCRCCACEGPWSKTPRWALSQWNKRLTVERTAPIEAAIQPEAKT